MTLLSINTSSCMLYVQLLQLINYQIYLLEHFSLTLSHTEKKPKLENTLLGMRNRKLFKPSSTSISPTSSASQSPKHHTFSESMMEENMETAESIITKYDTTTTAGSHCTISLSLFNKDIDNSEAKQYLQAVKNLHSAMKYFLKHDSHSNSDKLTKSHSLMKIAMKILQKEFYQILKSNRHYLSPESVTSSTHSTFTTTATNSSSSSSSDDDDDDENEEQERIQFQHDAVSLKAMDDLKSIAECMISVGHAKECIKIYKSIRKSIVDETLSSLKVEKLSPSQVQKLNWDTLELKIKAWLNAVKVALNTVFLGEKILCEHVFSSSSSPITESCFAEITKDGALTLFAFSENVGKCKNSPEKMFRILDLYEAIASRWADIEFIFSFESTSAVRSQALNSLIRLASAALTMLTDFESAIQKDPQRSPFPGGGVHPLTRYVMNYISFLSDYSEFLGDIIVEVPASLISIMPESYFDASGESPVSVKLAWLILVLLCKIDGKAELYGDASLAYLFLANNIEYVVLKVRDSNLKYILGEEWIGKHEAKVKKYAANYERIGWTKVFNSLPPPELLECEVSAEEAKQCFVEFNLSFEEVYRKQSAWVVQDCKLRDEIKVSLARKLVPAYRELYDKYRFVCGDVVRFAPDDLGNYLSDLFHGTGASGSVSSSSKSSSHCTRRR